MPSAPLHPYLTPRMATGLPHSSRSAMWAHLLRAHSLRAQARPGYYAALIAPLAGGRVPSLGQDYSSLRNQSSVASSSAHPMSGQADELNSSVASSHRSESHTSLLALEAEAAESDRGRFRQSGDMLPPVPRTVADVPEAVVAQIGKDLPRTFPNHAQFRDGGQLRHSLSNVLLAYAAHHPDHAYCQGMNFVVGLLLLVTPDDEELVFWEAVAIFEGILVNYFAPTLLGALVDIRVLRAMLAREAPELARCLPKEEVHIVASSWFLSLFINTFTPQSVLLILDSLFFCASSLFLVATAVATLQLNADVVLAEGTALGLRPPASNRLIYADPLPILACAHTILTHIPLATLDELRATSLADIQRSNEHAAQLDTLAALSKHANSVLGLARALSVLPPDFDVALPSRTTLDALLVRVQTRFGSTALLAPIKRIDSMLYGPLAVAPGLDDLFHGLAEAAELSPESEADARSSAVADLSALVDAVMVTLAELAAHAVGELVLDVLRPPLLASALAYYAAILHIKFVFRQAPTGLPFSPDAVADQVADSGLASSDGRQVFLCDDTPVIYSRLVSAELLPVSEAADTIMDMLTAFIRDSTSQLSEKVIHVLAHVSNTLNVLEEPLVLAQRQYKASRSAPQSLTLVAATLPAHRDDSSLAASPRSGSSPTLLARLFSGKRGGRRSRSGGASHAAASSPSAGLDDSGELSSLPSPTPGRKSRGQYKLEETILELIDTKAMLSGAGEASFAETDDDTMADAFSALASEVSILLQIIVETYYEFVFDMAFDALSMQGLAASLLASASSATGEAPAVTWSRPILYSQELAPPRFFPRLLAVHYVRALRTSSRARLVKAEPAVDATEPDSPSESLPARLHPVTLMGLQAVPLPVGPSELYALALLQELISLHTRGLAAPLLFAPLPRGAMYLEQLLHGAMFARPDDRAATFACITPVSFAMAALMAMIGDLSATGTSYILVPSQTAPGRFDLVPCLSYETGIAFSDPIVNDVETETAFVALANILFCMPNMHTPLPDSVVDRLLALYPERILLSWLARLRMKNNVYTAAAEAAVFTPHEMEAMGLPLAFVPGAPVRVYERLLRVQSLLRAKAQANLPTTAFEVLSHILPVVAATYMLAAEFSPEPNSVLTTIASRKALPRPAEELQLQRLRDARRDEYRGVSRELRRHGVWLRAGAADRVVEPGSALHAFLMHVNWASLAPLERQDRFLRAIRLLGFLEYLVIRYDSVNDDEDEDSVQLALTDASLESLLASLPQLRRLRLDCPLSNVSVNTLLRLSKLRSGSLSIELRPGLGMGVAGWAELTRQIPILLVLKGGSALFRIPLRPRQLDYDDASAASDRPFSSVLALMWPDIVRLLHVVVQLDDYETGLFLLDEVQAVGEAEHRYKMAAAAAQMGMAATGYLSLEAGGASHDPRSASSIKARREAKRAAASLLRKSPSSGTLSAAVDASSAAGPSFVQALVNARLGGLTPLQRAVHVGCERMVDLLLLNMASLDVIGGGAGGGLSGSAAASSASSSVASRSDAGPPPSLLAGLTPAQLACGLEEPILVDVDESADTAIHAWSPLTYAVIRGELSLVDRMLTEYKLRSKPLPSGIVAVAREKGTVDIQHAIRSHQRQVN
ncbi:growth hormone-regulated TBC protein 1-A [Thecamonas trahens ATCC 50062]|uniref:Growth hormone-regulated TBC protein 1-A n=1 Tax=Thecamonas trahens ATCC 50062 TaxID=461836 RepID=A0A0L0D101_THETB|nr:growth hormone-regulated TBC protein 1-A [Thecamonas trahens ATCC 50062]KNC45907.1 growth hormone-regulated TBC protein 1-A [Thecamonas trahens ATCC 50062]|eukprot:XP_013762895.1 growth hormone-regulated TBC protein 1-A [Thecamonas trahens ATCC 50062]